MNFCQSAVDLTFTTPEHQHGLVTDARSGSAQAQGQSANTPYASSPMRRAPTKISGTAVRLHSRGRGE